MSQRGFTLVEVVVAAAALSIVLLGVGTFYLSSIRIEEENTAQTFLQRQATIVMDEMRKQVERACTDLAVPGSPCPTAPPAPLVLGCGGVPDSLQVSVPAPGGIEVYCFKRDSSPNGTRLLVDRPGGNQWNLLSGAPATLTTTTGTCPDAGGFCPTLIVNNNTAKTLGAAITLRLRYRIPETSSFQTMTFTTTLAARN